MNMPGTLALAERRLLIVQEFVKGKRGSSGNFWAATSRKPMATATSRIREEAPVLELGEVRVPLLWLPRTERRRLHGG